MRASSCKLLPVIKEEDKLCPPKSPRGGSAGDVPVTRIERAIC
jgi:hypothetical protein